jgi:hypothetical protein
MIKKIIAVIVAAMCASAIVAVEPGLTPELTASASQLTGQTGSPTPRTNKPVQVATANASDISKAAEQNIRNDSRNGTSLCEQSWPYYRQSCLLGSNDVDSNARLVRVIDMDRPAAPSMYDNGRKPQARMP